MSTPTQDQRETLSKDLLQAFDNISGLHPGFRPAHAKGVMLSGTFTPSAEPRKLTSAPHVQQKSTPVTVRFSDSTGLPAVADNAPEASPRGFAVRFHLAEHVHTDIVSHSTDGFPARTAEEFLEFLRAAYASGSATTKPTPVEVFLGSHPKALEFVQTPKPIPTSFARESYFSVTAHKFTNGDGNSKYGRYRIRPEGGNEYLDATAAAAKPPNFLFDEIASRIAKGPVKLRILVQVAAEGDVVDDATVHWPENRVQVEFGMLELTRMIPNDDAEAQRIIFDPIPRVKGIDSSGDPLLEPRADLYLLSGRRRRTASKQTQAATTQG
jgi:catalase